jgi:hypothetical protein
MYTYPKEIKEVIKSLRLKKAPGLDQVTPKMLKELPQKGIVINLWSEFQSVSVCPYGQPQVGARSLRRTEMELSVVIEAWFSKITNI